MRSRGKTCDSRGKGEIGVWGKEMLAWVGSTVAPVGSFTVSPFCNLPKSGPLGTPSSTAFWGRNFPGRSVSFAT